jgi:hypothetical protein
MPAFPSRNFRLSDLILGFRIPPAEAPSRPDHADRGLFYFRSQASARVKDCHVDAAVNDDPWSVFFDSRSRNSSPIDHLLSKPDKYWRKKLLNFLEFSEIRRRLTVFHEQIQTKSVDQQQAKPAPGLLWRK